MFNPKSVDEVEQQLRALILARTPLNDFLEGSVAATLVRAIAHQFAATERGIAKVRNSFFIGSATGADLDERVAELPPVGITRIKSSPASGSGVEVRRSGDVSGTLTLPAGSTFANSNGVQYITVTDHVFAAGSSILTDIYVVATSSGSLTNTSEDTINVVVTAPSAVVSCTNTIALTNGADEESDSSLQSRAIIYLQSLSRSQPTALTFLAKSFVAGDGSRMRYASLFEDVEQPGYSELVVDDGTGITAQGVSSVGQVTTGVLTNGGYSLLYHETPATAPMVANVNVQVRRNGTLISLRASDIVSIPERGLVYLKDTAPVQAGDTWEISGYRVYKGFVAELQQEIEGNTSNPAVLSGFRAAGTRVRVVAAEREVVRFDVAIQTQAGAVYGDVQSRLKTALTDYINGLEVGSPLLVSSLVTTARGVFGVSDVIFYGRGTSDLMRNVYPSDRRTALRADSSSIVIAQTPVQ